MCEQQSYKKHLCSFSVKPLQYLYPRNSLRIKLSTSYLGIVFIEMCPYFTISQVRMSLPLTTSQVQLDNPHILRAQDIFLKKKLHHQPVFQK